MLSRSLRIAAPVWVAATFGSVLALAACESNQDLGEVGDAGTPPNMGIEGSGGRPSNGAGVDPGHARDAGLARDAGQVRDAGQADANDGAAPACSNEPEQCNGSDDDCDGRIDEDDDCEIGVETGALEIYPGFLELAVDAHDNVYASGTYVPELPPYPDPPALSGRVLPKDHEIVIASYDASHKLRWLSTFDGDVYYAPKLVARGDALFMLGSTTQAIDLPVQGGTTHVNGAYVAALSAKDGTFLWVTPLDTPSPPNPGGFVLGPRGIALDAGGDIYVALTKGGEMAAIGAYYGRLAADGTLRWLKPVNILPSDDPISQAQLADVAVSRQGTVYLCGDIMADVEIGGCMIAGRDKAAFVAALDGDGTCLWEQHLPGDPGRSDSNHWNAIAVDAKDGVVALGILTHDVSFQGHALAGAADHDSLDSAALLALALDAKGSFLWSWRADSNDGLEDESMAVDGDSNLYLGLGRGALVGLDAQGRERFTRSVPWNPPMQYSDVRGIALTSDGSAVITSGSALAYVDFSRVKY
jgi:outer membrane protein assembly factor BamB